VGSEFIQKRAFHIPQCRLAPRVAGDEHNAPMPQGQQVACRRNAWRHLVRPGAGELQPVRATIQREAGSRLRGKPFEQFARAGDHDPGIGRAGTDLPGDALEIVAELDLGFPGEKHLVITHAKVVLNLEQQLGRFVLAVRQRVVLENAHPQPVVGCSVRRDNPAATGPARL